MIIDNLKICRNHLKKYTIKELLEMIKLQPCASLPGQTPKLIYILHYQVFL